MEFVIAGAITGLVLLFALHQFVARRSEAKDAEYLRDSLREMRNRSDFWYNTASKEADTARAAVERLELDLADALAQMDREGEVMTRAADHIEDLNTYLAESEADLDEAEEALSDLAHTYRLLTCPYGDTHLIGSPNEDVGEHDCDQNDCRNCHNCGIGGVPIDSTWNLCPTCNAEDDAELEDYGGEDVCRCDTRSEEEPIW